MVCGINSGRSRNQGAFEGGDINLAKSLGLAFGISAAACLIGGLIPFPGADVQTKDFSSLLKECVLDSSAKTIGIQLAAELANSYINWAVDGFEGRPTFIENPNTFWKDFTDRAIGDALDRAGLGFLCDFEGFRIDIGDILHARYTRLVFDPPRCTLSDFENNIEDLLENPIEVRGGVRTSVKNKRVDIYNRNESIEKRIDDTKKYIDRHNNFIITEGTPLEQLQRSTAAADQIAKDAEEQAEKLASDDGTTLSRFDCLKEELVRVGDKEQTVRRIDLDECIVKEGAVNINDWVNDLLKQNLDINITEADEFGEIIQAAADATAVGLINRVLKEGRGKTYRGASSSLGQVRAATGNRQPSPVIELPESKSSNKKKESEFTGVLLKLKADREVLVEEITALQGDETSPRSIANTERAVRDITRALAQDQLTGEERRVAQALLDQEIQTENEQRALLKRFLLQLEDVTYAITFIENSLE